MAREALVNIITIKNLQKQTKGKTVLSAKLHKFGKIFRPTSKCAKVNMHLKIPMMHGNSSKFSITYSHGQCMSEVTILLCNEVALAVTSIVLFGMCRAN